MTIRLDDAEASAMCFAIGAAKRIRQSVDVVDGKLIDKCLNLIQAQLIAEGRREVSYGDDAEWLKEVVVHDMNSDCESGKKAAEAFRKEVA